MRTGGSRCPAMIGSVRNIQESGVLESKFSVPQARRGSEHRGQRRVGSENLTLPIERCRCWSLFQAAVFDRLDASLSDCVVLLSVVV